MPKKTSIDAPATIIVTLPEDAKLTIDGNATTSTSNRRVFVSPTLQADTDYVYTLRAEIVREGRTIAETQQVTVRAGVETPVAFNLAASSVASR